MLRLQVGIQHTTVMLCQYGTPDNGNMPRTYGLGDNETLSHRTKYI